MRKLEVTFEDGRVSPLFVGSDLLRRIGELFELKKYTKIFVLSEEGIFAHWGGAIEQCVPNAIRITVPAGEGSKSVETLARIWSELLAARADRKSLLINLGGGMITDLGGFAASTYMRGMSCINVPTTLLSQVDASIGGKTGINLEGVKNCIGSFAQPLGVVIDVDTLHTLSPREFASGFAEIVKHGFIADDSYLSEIEGYQIRDGANCATLESIIYRSCEIKRDVVSRDEREGGFRKLLNFGHTLGHAIESISHSTASPMLHGEAISLGMVGEAYLSHLLGYLTEAEVDRMKKVLLMLQLPVVLPSGYEYSKIRALMEQDKKNTGGEISWTLLKGIGEGIFDVKVGDKEIQAAFEYLGSDE